MPPFLSLLHQLVLRYLTRHKLIALFDLLSIAVGVSVYLAIQTANQSANAAFRSTIDLIAGKSHLEVRGLLGGVDEALLSKFQNQPGVAAVTPVLEGYATLSDFPGEYLHLTGTDPFTSAPFGTVGAAAADSPSYDLENWLGRPRSIFVHPELLNRTGRKIGDHLAAEVNGQRVELRVAGELPVEDLEKSAPSSLAVMDIGWAQELLGEAGKLSAIQILVTAPDRMEEIRQDLAKLLPPGVTLQSPDRRGQQVQRMLQGFQLNITALSLVSILVGVFLIYNSVSASVVRRRREIGILRSNGASPRQILGLFLAEGLLLGLPGVILGLPLGAFLASAFVGQVAETISSHYVLVSVNEASLDPRHSIFAIVFGLAAVLLGAWLPAWEASRIPPLQALQPRNSTPRKPMRTGRWLVIGAVGLIFAIIFSVQALTLGPPWVSFLACLCLVAGFSLATPWICRGLSRWISRLAADRVLLRTASDHLGRSLHRSAVTVAALMMAISMTIGVTVMVSSFRTTIDVWVNQAMTADLYLTTAANEVIGFQSYVPAEIVSDLRARPEVKNVETYRQAEIVLEDGAAFTLGVVEGREETELSFVGGNGAEKFRKFLGGGHALVTEPLANRLRLKDGDGVTLPTPAGPRSFPVAGIYYDYTDDRGKLILTRADFLASWGDDRIHSLQIILHDPARADKVAEDLRKRFGPRGELAIYNNRGIREEIFRIFDQTFAVTYVLRTVAILVAVFGVSLSLSTLVMERTREIGIFRAIGASSGQVRVVYLLEAGLLGLFSSVIGVVCGLGMAMILTWVVNKAFFGWTIQFHLPWLDLLATPLWVVPAAVLAGLIPAANAARLSVNEAVRAE